MMILDFIKARLDDAQPSIDRVLTSLLTNASGRHDTPYADSQVTRFEAMCQLLADARGRGYPSDPEHDEAVQALASRWANHPDYRSAVGYEEKR